MKSFRAIKSLLLFSNLYLDALPGIYKNINDVYSLIKKDAYNIVEENGIQLFENEYLDIYMDNKHACYIRACTENNNVKFRNLIIYDIVEIDQIDDNNIYYRDFSIEVCNKLVDHDNRNNEIMINNSGLILSENKYDHYYKVKYHDTLITNKFTIREALYFIDSFILSQLMYNTINKYGNIILE